MGPKRIIALLGGLPILLLAVGLVAALWAPAPLPTPEPGTVLRGVMLVEPGIERDTEWNLDAGSRHQGPVDIVIEGNRINRIVPSDPAAPSGSYAKTFVLPGLTDMHAHFPTTGFPGDDRYTSLLYLLHGVTTVRLTGGVDAATAADLNTRAAEGKLAAPTYLTCGPIIDGPGPVIPGSASVTAPEEAVALTNQLAQEGVDCIKVYDKLNLETLRAIQRAAHAHNLPVVGHIPHTVPLSEAKLDDVQHLRGMHPPFEDEDLRYPYFLKAWLRADPTWIAETVAISRGDGMAHTPTLAALDGTLQSENWTAWRESETIQLWPPHLRDGMWSGDVGLNPGRFASPETFAMVRQAGLLMKQTVRTLHDAGVPIHTGTDANAPNVVPGASLHRELALLVEAGLKPDQALAASTRTSPAFLGRENAGQLRPGARADLILLRADPREDIDALADITAVIAGGRFFTREDLEARIARYQAHYESWPYRFVLMPLLRTALFVIVEWLRR